jgi:hypothetical protein
MNLKRKAVVLPVAGIVLALVGIAAFEGYGAYTRSKPVHYDRGGNAFALTDEPTPTATARATSPTPGTSTTSAPVATRTAGPSSAAPHPSATADVAPPVAQPTQKPAVTRTLTPQGIAVPKTGTYGLAVQGSEKVKFGPVSFCNQKLPTSTHLVVSKAKGESGSSYDFDVPFFPGQSGQHDERHIYRYTKDEVLLDYEIATVTCQGVRQSSSTSFVPEQRRVALPLKVGASWTYKGGGADRTESSTTHVLRTETLAIDGARVLTYVIETKTSFTGDESGTRDQTWWYAPTWAMPVKWHEKQSGQRSGASYTGDITATVTSHP